MPGALLLCRISSAQAKATVDALWDEAISPHDIDKGSEDRWAARVTVREHSTWDMAAYVCVWPAMCSIAALLL